MVLFKIGGKDTKKATDYAEIHSFLSLICVNLRFFCNFAAQKNKIVKICIEVILVESYGSLMPVAL